MIGGEQAHDDARGAETALRAVQVDHRLLHRVQRVALGQILDRDEFDPVKLAEQQNAGVDRFVAQPPALQARQDDGAGAAIAFAAALFRPLGELLLAQPIEDGGARRETVDLDIAAAEAKAQRSPEFRRYFRHNVRLRWSVGMMKGLSRKRKCDGDYSVLLGWRVAASGVAA